MQVVKRRMKHNDPRLASYFVLPPETAKGKSGHVLNGRSQREGEFFIDNLLVQIHFIIVIIGWTGLAPWEFESPFIGSFLGRLTSTFLGR